MEKDRYYYHALLVKKFRFGNQVEVCIGDEWITGKVVVTLFDTEYEYICVKCDVIVNAVGYLDGFGIRIPVSKLSLLALENYELLVIRHVN